MWRERRPLNVVFNPDSVCCNYRWKRTVKTCWPSSWYPRRGDSLDSVCYLWWVPCVTPWPAAPQTGWACGQHQPERTSAAESHPLASGPSAPERRCGRSPPYCWLLTRCHLRNRKHSELMLGLYKKSLAWLFRDVVGLYVGVSQSCCIMSN